MYIKIFKYNPYHDRRGRFTTPGKATFVSVGQKFGKPKKTTLGLDAKEFDERFANALDDVKKTRKHLLGRYKDLENHPDKKAITKYTGFAFFDINRYLREGVPIFKEERSLIPKIDRFLGSAPKLDKDIVLHRGIAVKPGSVFDKMLREGGVFRDEGFMSTTIDSKKTFSGNYTMRILAKAGTEGAYIERVSSRKMEKEFLLPKGAHLKIHKRDEATKTIYAEVLT